AHHRLAKSRRCRQHRLPTQSRETWTMNKLTAAVTSVVLSLGFFGGGGSAHAEGSNYTISNYIVDNHITATEVHPGDPGAPTINRPVTAGWQVNNYLDLMDNPPYAGIVSQPSDRISLPLSLVGQLSIVASVSKLTSAVDEAKIIQYAPGEV